MHCFMITSVQKTSSPLRFLLRKRGGGVCTQGILWGSPEIGESYEYYHEYWNYEYFPEDFCPRLWLFLSSLFTFLPCLLLYISIVFLILHHHYHISIVFLSPPPLPPQETQLTLFIFFSAFHWSSTWKNKEAKSKMLFPPSLIIQHPNTNSHIICFIARIVLLFSFVSNAVNYNVVFFSYARGRWNSFNFV